MNPLICVNNGKDIVDCKYAFHLWLTFYKDFQKQFHNQDLQKNIYMPGVTKHTLIGFNAFIVRLMHTTLRYHRPSTQNKTIKCFYEPREAQRKWSILFLVQSSNRVKHNTLNFPGKELWSPTCEILSRKIITRNFFPITFYTNRSLCQPGMKTSVSWNFGGY